MVGRFHLFVSGNTQCRCVVHAAAEQEKQKMKLVACVVLVLAVLWGCSSPPKPPEPTGQWVPVNQPTAQQASRTEPK